MSFRIDAPLVCFGLNLIGDVPAQPKPVLFPTASPGQIYPLKILLAEDDAINQKVALRLLERLNYQAEVVNNGFQVLEALAVKRFDLILMDMQMPEMDGVKTTRQIHQLWAQNTQGYPRPRIIALTANALQDDRTRCLDAGMDDYLSKPIRKLEFAAKLAHWAGIIGQAIALEFGQKSPINPSILANSMINWPYLQELADDDQAFIDELLSAFIAENWGRLDRLEIAIATHNTEKIKYLAHQIKGSSSNLGLGSIETLASQLESSTLESNPEILDRLLASFRQSMNQIKSEFSTHQGIGIKYPL
jgi:CheY-like chemotaxis protein/HPt (histidine-containing phosphotransfer) domain-containing protein